MNFSFAEHIVEIQSWTTKTEMLNFLAQCDAGRLVLGKDVEQEVAFYSATVHLDYSALANSNWNAARGDRFGVGLCSEGQGLRPHLLLLPEKQVLVFGFNAEVVGISVRDQEILFRIAFDYLPFRSFIHLWQQETILAFHEIGVVALTEEGKELWRYDKDVITGCTVDIRNLHLKFMDSPSVSINIASGSVVTNNA